MCHCPLPSTITNFSCDHQIRAQIRASLHATANPASLGSRLYSTPHAHSLSIRCCVACDVHTSPSSYHSSNVHPSKGFTRPHCCSNPGFSFSSMKCLRGFLIKPRVFYSLFLLVFSYENVLWTCCLLWNSDHYL